jgi:hypothetical protein
MRIQTIDFKKAIHLIFQLVSIMHGGGRPGGLVNGNNLHQC